MAAEKFRIFEAEIDTKAATDSVIALKETIILLKEKAKEAKATQGELSGEYTEYQAAIKATNAELRKAEAVTAAVITSNYSEAGSITQLRAQLAIVTSEWNNLSKKDRENLEVGKKLSAQKLQLTETLKKEEAATGDARRNVGNYSESIKGALGSLKSFVPGAGKATTAAKTLGGGFKAMLGPIAIIIAVVTAVVSAFKSFFESSEEGQNKLASFKAAFSAVFGVINDIISSFVSTIISAFENPKQAISDLWEAIKTNLVNRVVGLMDTFKAVGKVLKGVFTLDWDMIKEGASEAGESYVQVLTGVDDYAGKAANALKKLGNEINDKTKKAMALAQRQAALDKQIRDATVKNGKDVAAVAKLREQVAEKSNRTSAERLKLLDEAIALETEIENRNVAIAKEKHRIKQGQNALSKSTKEALEEEANLLAAVYAAEMAASNKRKELQGQRAQMLAKELEVKREIAETAVSSMEHELAMYKLTLDKKAGLTEKVIADELAIKEAGLKIQLSALEAQENISEELRNAKKLELENQFLLDKATLYATFEEQERAREDEKKAMAAEAASIDFQNEMENARNNIFAKLELEKEGLELKKQQELEYADLIGADKEGIEKKYTDKALAIERTLQNAKLELAAGFAGNLATIFGNNTKVGKAAAAAETAINTYKGAMSAYSSFASLGPVGVVLGAVAAGAVVKKGYDAIKKIYAVKTDAKGGGGASISSSASATPSLPKGSSATSAPSFMASQAVTPQTAASVSGQIAGTSTTTGGQSSQQVLVVDDVTYNQTQINRSERLGTLL